MALEGEGGRPHLQGVLSDITEAVHQQRELDAIRRINGVLTAQPALDELAEFVGLLVEETLRPEVTVVALYDTDDESLSYPFASESGERVLQPTSALARDSVSAVIRDRTIVRNDDGSFLGVPIRAGDEAIGVLAVESPGATRFDEADAHLLAAIAVGIAPTIRSAHLLRALRASELHYRRLVEAIPVAMYRASEGEQNSSEYMSPRAVAMFGYPLEAWSDPDFYSRVLHPDDRDWVLAENDLPLTDDDSIWVSDYRMLTADGRTIWIHDESWTVRDENGKAQFVQGCMIDVTEQKGGRGEARGCARRDRPSEAVLRSPRRGEPRRGRRDGSGRTESWAGIPPRPRCSGTSPRRRSDARSAISFSRTDSSQTKATMSAARRSRRGRRRGSRSGRGRTARWCRSRC